MTTQAARPLAPEIPGSLALWRVQYPHFRVLVDEGAPPLRALRYLGLALWQDGRLNEAAEVLTEAADLAPHDAIVLAELGSLLTAMGRKGEALRRLIASLNFAPGQMQTWLTVAGLCVEMGATDTAEKAFRAALELDGGSADAAAGLGLLYIGQRRFDEAAQLLSAAVARGIVAMPVYACLGQTLYQLGDFANAGRALEKAARACPGEARIILKYAEARLVETMIDGSVVEAVETYLAIAGRHAEDLGAVCGKAFQVLCAYGRKEAAIRLGEVLLKRTPDDPIVSYHLDALLGRTHARAPDAYLTACFGAYADDFERHLVQMLDYRGPEKLQALLGESGLAFRRILDLGCGTGLAAPYLKSFEGQLTGVDIAPRMLDKAGQRNAYDALVESEALAYLEAGTATFDLIVALDVLIYFGDLDALFAAAAARLEPGGVFACSFEAARDVGVTLQPCGRFAHHPAYVQAVYARNFSLLARDPTTMRHEAARPVAGELLLLRRA